MKSFIFARRNLTETLRDTLSYIFCLGFPIVMLIIMTLVNESIPVEANMTIFRIDNLTGGIIIFGQTFIMLFTTLNVSKDRTGSFMIRMYATPMKSADFVIGYIMPMLVLSVIQSIITVICGFIISLFTGFSFNIWGLIAVVIASIPSALMFTGIGILFGSIFNDKAAPGLCSIIISLGSFIGGIWFDAEQTGGVLLSISECTPFIYCTRAVRSAISLNFSFSRFCVSELIVTAAAIIIVLLGFIAFRRKMRADLG